MNIEAEIEVPGEVRRHTVRLEIDFKLRRNAPRASNPDDPAFSDPGDPGAAHIVRGVVILERESKAIRERAIPPRVIETMRADDRLEDFLYEHALANLPRE